MGEDNRLLTNDELSAVYRMEVKTGAMTAVRRDLYKAMAVLQKSLQTECNGLLTKDPDSILAEGINQRRKTCKDLCDKIVHIRMRKILKMAVRGAEGADNPIDKLTEEERTFYDMSMSLCKDHLEVLKKLNGSKTYSSPDISKVISKTAEPAPKRTAELVEEERSKDAPPLPVKNEAPAEEIPIPDDDVLIEDESDFAEEEISTELPLDELDIPSEVRKKRELIQPSDEAPLYRMNEMMMIRVLAEDIPTFAGPIQNYTLRKEDVLLMPEPLALMLIKNQKAEQVTPSP